jgi:hypothetical protein
MRPQDSLLRQYNVLVLVPGTGPVGSINDGFLRHPYQIQAVNERHATNIVRSVRGHSGERDPNESYEVTENSV